MELPKSSGSLRRVESATIQSVDVPALPVRWLGLKSGELILMLVVSATVLLASYRGWWSIAVTEAWGFVTGGVCVWLVVRENLWNWPIGLANNVFFFALFLQGRLYADMSLQLVYLALGAYGWWNWVFGGENRRSLKIGRVTRSELIWSVFILLAGTPAMREILLKVQDSSPWLDAVTTMLSLVAQFLLCRKKLENWWFWMAADIIYIPLYFSRSLPLTAVLYAGFVIMCLAGLIDWRRKIQASGRLV